MRTSKSVHKPWTEQSWGIVNQVNPSVYCGALFIVYALFVLLSNVSLLSNYQERFAIRPLAL